MVKIDGYLDDIPEDEIENVINDIIQVIEKHGGTLFAKWKTINEKDEVIEGVDLETDANATYKPIHLTRQIKATSNQPDC